MSSGAGSVVPVRKYQHSSVETEQCLKRDARTGLVGINVFARSCSLCSADRGFLLSVISELVKGNGLFEAYLVIFRGKKKLVVSAVNKTGHLPFHSSSYHGWQ